MIIFVSDPEWVWDSYLLPSTTNSQKKTSEKLNHLLYERSMRMTRFAPLGSRRNRSLTQTKINKFKAYTFNSDFTSLILYDYATELPPEKVTLFQQTIRQCFK